MDGATETYLDVHRFIAKLCHGFLHRYGGDFDELYSQANLLFMRAYRSHKEEKGPFIAWLKLNVQYGLYDEFRKQSSRQARLPRVDLDLDTTCSPSLGRLISGDHLSQDARHLVELVGQMPADLEELLRLSNGKKEDGLWDFLRGLGWTADRIRESFDEIREALT